MEFVSNRGFAHGPPLRGVDIVAFALAKHAGWVVEGKAMVTVVGAPRAGRHSARLSVVEAAAAKLAALEMRKAMKLEAL